MVSEIISLSKNISKLDLSQNPICGVDDSTGNGVFDALGVQNVCNAILLRANAAHNNKTNGSQPIVELNFGETCLCNLSRQGDRMHRILFNPDFFVPLKAICQVIKETRCVESINLANNLIGCKSQIGIKAVARRILTTPSLTSVDLSGNRISGEYYDCVEGVEELAEVLQNPATKLKV
jgi:hypothetical protein